MDVKDYCSNMRSDLAGWKTKLDKISQGLGKASPEDRKRYAASLEELNALTSDLEGGIAELEKECPLDWEPQKEILDRKAEDLSMKYRQMAAELSPDDFE